MRLDIYRHQAGLAPGAYMVGATERGTGIVRLDRDGETQRFDPRSLHHAGQGAALAVPGVIEVREGDRLVFTGTDKTRGMTNGTAVTLDRIEGGTLHLSGRDRDHLIAPDDPMRERLGHGAVLNMHRAQGITVDRAITVMDSHDRLLNSQSLYYVLQTRAREDMTLHTNDRVALVAAIESHRGDVPHALDLAPELSPSGGERFDPATGELAPAEVTAERAESRDARLLDAMSAALQAIGQEEVATALVRLMPDAVTPIVDDGRLEHTAQRRSGEKTAASELMGQKTSPSPATADTQIRLPGPSLAVADAIGRYARAFAAVETAARQRGWPEREDIRAMHAGADRLDQLRPSGAEDLRTVLDCTPELAREIAAGRVDQAWQAWADEGRARASNGPDYADRFVADWRAASGERVVATGKEATWKAERKLERLAERMDAQPALERALEKHIPERQLEIDLSVISRARDMDMDMGR